MMSVMLPYTICKFCVYVYGEKMHILVENMMMKRKQSRLNDHKLTSVHCTDIMLHVFSLIIDTGFFKRCFVIPLCTFILCSNCVALLHCTLLHRNCDVKYWCSWTWCCMKVKFILTWNAVMLQWLAAESNWYINIATQLQCVVNGPLLPTVSQCNPLPHTNIQWRVLSPSVHKLMWAKNSGKISLFTGYRIFWNPQTM